jgi:hypothetical protein
MPRTASKRFLLSALLLAAGPLPFAGADLGPLEPIADLHRAVRESLGLPEPMIVRALERGLPADDLPAAGLIAARAEVPLESVVDLRLGGMAYADITVRFGLGPEIFYVPFDADPGPPYGNAWGHFRKTPRERWRTLRLADADVVHYANLRLCVDHYRVAPVEVVALHRKSKGFAGLHRELVAKAKPAKAQKTKSAEKAKKVEKAKSSDKAKGTEKAKAAEKSKSAKSKADKSAKGGKKAKPAKPDKPPAR